MGVSAPLPLLLDLYAVTGLGEHYVPQPEHWVETCVKLESHPLLTRYTFRKELV